MLIPFICGTFHHQEEDGQTMSSSACSTPKKSRRNGFSKSKEEGDQTRSSSACSTPKKSRRNGFSKNKEEDDQTKSCSACSTPKKSRRNGFSKNKDNPYSTRGLDKFSALLADLEEKKQKIYAETAAQDISFVRFVYKNSNDCVPIVIKLKDKKDEKTKIEDVKATEQVLPVEEEKQSKLASDKYNNNKKSFSWNTTKLGGWKWKWNRPSYYLPVVVILILLFLALFGRSVAILCTSIGWYVVPKLKESSDRKKSMKKKEYVRKLSQPKMKSDGLSSPNTNRTGPVKDNSPRQHGQWKSW